MPHVDRFVSVTEAKNRLLDLIRGLKSRPEIVAITRDGVPAAVLLSIDQFEGLMETIEILSDRQAMRSLRRSLKQAEAGQWVTHESVFGRGPV
jgi:antitoxin YefM